MPISVQTVDKDGNRKEIEREDKEFSKGGEGAVYRSTDNRYIVKIFYDHMLDHKDEKALKEILRAAPEPNSPVADCLAWPLALTISPTLNRVNGVVTVNAAFSRWMEPMIWYFSPGPTLSLPPDRQGTFAGRVKAAINLAEAVNYLNRIGYAHADLSGRNILCNPVEGRSILIDLDGLVVPGYMAGAVIGTPDFMAPELVQGMLTSSHVSPTSVTDRHALAVCFYQLLLMQHPLKGGKRKPLHTDAAIDDLLQTSPEYAIYKESSKDASNRPKGPYLSAAILGPELEKLFRRAFEDGIKHPDQRPRPYEWVEALQHLQAELIHCPNAECAWWGYYSSLGGQVEHCPMCGTDTPKIAIGNALIMIEDKRRPGFFSRQGNSQSLYRNKPLNRHDIFGDAQGKKADVIAFSTVQGKWQVELHERIEAWVIDARNDTVKRLEPGKDKAVQFTDQARILLINQGVRSLIEVSRPA